MERTEFDRTLKDFEMFFSDLTDWQRDEYYDALHKYPQHLFQKAYKRLRNAYRLKRTPLPGEIEEAMQEILDESTQGPVEEAEGCEACGWTGIRASYVFDKNLNNDYFLANPCSCPKGKRFQKSWDLYRRKKS